MRELFTFLLPIAGLCAVVALTTPTTDEADFSAAGVQRRVAELRGALEEELGAPLPARLDVRVSRPAELERLLAAETVQIMGAMEDGMRGAALERFAEAQAKVLSRGLFGKVELNTGVLHIVPANFRWMSELSRRLAGLKSQAFLDVILIHELVHVHQHARFGLDRLVGQPETLPVFQGRQAVIEGHAQYVTRRVAEKLGLSESYDLLVRAQTGGVKTDRGSAAERILKSLATFQAFPYVEGARLVGKVVDEFGFDEAVRRLFRDPPRSTQAVTRPEEELSWMSDKALFWRAVRRVARLLEGAEWKEAEKRQGHRGAAALATERARVALSLCINEETAAMEVVAVGREVELDGGAAAYEAGALAFAHGDVAGTITVPDGERRRERAVRTARRVREIVRATYAGSPWTGLTGRKAGQAACLAALVDPHWGVRWRAIRNLGRFPPEVDGVEAALRAALADPEPIVRLAALRALRNRGWATGDELKDDPDWEVAAQARTR